MFGCILAAAAMVKQWSLSLLGSKMEAVVAVHPLRKLFPNTAILFNVLQCQLIISFFLLCQTILVFFVHKKTGKNSCH